MRLLPILQQLSRGGSGSTTFTKETNYGTVSSLGVEDMKRRILLLEQTVQNLSSPPPVPTFMPPPVSSSVDSSRLLDLEAKMKQLQLRVVGKGVQIANKVFQSFDEVQTWVATHLPSRRYGLFVDRVSIFEVFTHGHMDAETTYSSFYSQHRTGFQSSYEARVASSIQNLFPAIFGKSDSNVDTAESLPALPTPEQWDSNDGNTGLRYQITRNMADVELQISESISTILRDNPEALYIARECLHQSKRFALELAQFITLDFQKWKHRGHAKKDAWKMTAVCVRRIFEELYSERVVARDIYDQKDQEFTTAKYLWATWKAHRVMEKCLRHQFYEHPSISAVLARHLADNYVKPDEAQGSKIKALEMALKALQSKVDTLRNSQAITPEKEVIVKEVIVTPPPNPPKNLRGKLVIGSG